MQDLAIEIRATTPDSEDALVLIRALDEDLRGRYPGVALHGLHPEDVRERRLTFLIAYSDGRAIGCGGPVNWNLLLERSSECSYSQLGAGRVSLAISWLLLRPTPEKVAMLRCGLKLPRVNRKHSVSIEQPDMSIFRRSVSTLATRRACALRND